MNPVDSLYLERSETIKEKSQSKLMRLLGGLQKYDMKCVVALVSLLRLNIDLDEVLYYIDYFFGFTT
jgi:hypothetical protein